MSFSKIKNDAEDLTLDKKIIKSIGGKIIGIYLSISTWV